MTDSIATKAIHAGAFPGEAEDGVMNPLVLATSFLARPEGIGFSANDLNGPSPLLYTRWNNPTNDLLERRLADLEEAEAAVAFASGMAATAGLWLTLLKAGDHLLLSNVCYAGVAELAQDILPDFGIAVTTVDSSDLAAVANSLRPETRLVHIETPCNPILRLADIAAIARLVHENGAELAVDSTMATPVATRPIALGADYVIHSLTKYCCGHGDALGGIVVGRSEAMAAVRKRALIHFGAVINPFAAWLILRGLETLPARMAAIQAGAETVARFLENHPRVRRVLYPGLASHPQHDLARRQMNNFSGMVSFSAEGSSALASQLADRLKLFSYAVSLGKARSLAFYIPAADLLRSSFRLEGRDADSYHDWTGEGTFRLSIGLETPADLIADLDQALNR